MARSTLLMRDEEKQVKTRFYSISKDEAKSELQEYKTISINDIEIKEKNPILAQEIKDYWSVVGHAFQEQAAIKIQKWMRKKLGTSYKGKLNPISYTSSLRFIKEPLNDKFLEHAKHIKNGDWLKIDFNDIDFTRNIFKALRYGFIDSYDASTVIHWHDAIQFFSIFQEGVNVSQYSFRDKKGPYQPETISYSTAENIATFNTSLNKLPLRNASYLTIDLPALHEALFLATLINWKQNFKHDIPRKYLEILKKYISKLTISSAEKKNFLNYLNKNDLSEMAEIEKFITTQLNSFRIIGAYDKTTLNFEYAGFLLLIMAVQMPCFETSPNYRLENPNSPVLCMILPTVSAMLELQKAMHDVDTSFPAFVTGRFSPRDTMKFLFTNSSKIYRPIELVHPDVVRQVKTHDVEASDFLLTFHDFFHMWQTGSNCYKRLFFHLIHSLRLFTTLEMSKKIYLLVDMEFSGGMTIRENLKNPNHAKYHFIKQLCDFLHVQLGNELWDKPNTFDNNLLIIIDMIANREAWKKWLYSYPEDFFPNKTFTTNEWTINEGVKLIVSPKIMPYKFTDFFTVFKVMANIIRANPIENKQEAALTWILLYRFKGITNLINQVRNKGISNFFAWDTNHEIYISHPFLKEQKIFIANLSDSEITRHIKNMLTIGLPANRVSTSLLKSKASLFSQQTTIPLTKEVKSEVYSGNGLKLKTH